VDVHFFFVAKKKRTKEKTRGCVTPYQVSAAAMPVVAVCYNAALGAGFVEAVGLSLDAII